MSAIVLAKNKERAEKYLKENGYMILSSKKLENKKYVFAFAVKPHYRLFPVKRNMESLVKKLYETKGMILSNWYDDPNHAEENLKFLSGQTTEDKIDRYF